VTSGRPDAEDREPTRRTVSINTSLMWEILDYTFAGHNHGPTYSTSSSSASPSPNLFHDSLFPITRATTNQSHTVVETQIFHVPAGEPDTSDGGQAMPPYAGHAINSSSDNNNNNSAEDEDVDEDDADADADTSIHNQLTTRPGQQQQQDQGVEDDTTPTNTPGSSSVAAAAAAAAAAAQRVQMQYPPLAELANSPWAFSGNLSVIDGGGGGGSTSRDPFFQFQDIGSPFLGLWEVGSL
jgi:hypothetical protein